MLGFNSLFNAIKDDLSKMLIYTGAATWIASGLAQSCAIIKTPKFTKEQKSFLLPQELADTAVNICMFLLITCTTRGLVKKSFSTGKFTIKSVRDIINQKLPALKDKVGTWNFDLKEALKKNNIDEKYFAEHFKCQNFATLVSTIIAGIISTNIVTPIIRNNMAAVTQKKMLENKSVNEKTQYMPSNTQVFKGYSLKI